jgi:glutathione S-transferase
VRAAYRARLAVNLANGSTAAGVLVAAAGRARLRRGRDGLLIGDRYRLPLPDAPAFTLGNVILTRMDAAGLAAAGEGRLLVHEARHATQYACCGGLLMLPAYFAAAGWSWALTGDFGARNVFERRAGLADGGYSERPARPAITAWRSRLPARAAAARAAAARIPAARTLAARTPAGGTRRGLTCRAAGAPRPGAGPAAAPVPGVHPGPDRR